MFPGNERYSDFMPTGTFLPGKHSQGTKFWNIAEIWALLTKPEAAAVLAEPDAAALAPGQAEQEEAQAKTRTSSYIKIGGKIWEGGGEEKIEKIFG